MQNLLPLPLRFLKLCSIVVHKLKIMIVDGASNFLVRREEILRRFIDSHRNHMVEEGDLISDEDIARSAGTYGIDGMISKQILDGLENTEFYIVTSGLAIDSQEVQRKIREHEIEEYLNISLKQPTTVSMNMDQECLDPCILNNSITDTVHDVDIFKALEAQGICDHPVLTGAKEEVFAAYVSPIPSDDITIDPNKSPAGNEPLCNTYLNKPRFSLPLHIEENPYEDESYLNKTNQSQPWSFGDESITELNEPSIPWYLSGIKYSQGWRYN